MAQVTRRKFMNRALGGSLYGLIRHSAPFALATSLAAPGVAFRPSPAHASPVALGVLLSHLAQIAANVEVAISVYNATLGRQARNAQVRSLSQNLDKISGLQGEILQELNKVAAIARDSVRRAFLNEDIAELQLLAKDSKRFLEASRKAPEDLQLLASRANRLVSKISQHSTDLATYPAYMTAISLQLALHAEMGAGRDVIEQVIAQQTVPLTFWSQAHVPARIEEVEKQIAPHQAVAEMPPTDINLVETVYNKDRRSGAVKMYFARFQEVDPETRRANVRFMNREISPYWSSGKVKDRYYSFFYKYFYYPHMSGGHKVQGSGLLYQPKAYESAQDGTEGSLLAKQKFKSLKDAIDRHMEAYFHLTDQRKLLDGIAHDLGTTLKLMGALVPVTDAGPAGATKASSTSP